MQSHDEPDEATDCRSYDRPIDLQIRQGASKIGRPPEQDDEEAFQCRPGEECLNEPSPIGTRSALNVWRTNRSAQKDSERGLTSS